MTLAMFFGGAWGYLRLLKFPVAPGDPGALPDGGGSLLSNGPVLLALAAVVVTAVLAGVLAVVPQISPLATGLPGLLLIGWTALYLVSVRRATALIPLRSHAFGAGWEALLFNGVLGAVGLAMIVPMCVPSRWRASRPRPAGRGASEAARPGGDRGNAAPSRDPWEPAAAHRGTGGMATGPIGQGTGPIRPRTTSPIRTTGPIRLNPPQQR